MNLELSPEQVYLLRYLIHEEMDRVGGILNLPTELTEICKKLTE